MGKRKKRDENSENWSYKNDFPIEEVWGTYHYIARDIVPRLKAFKALDKHGHAPGFKDITAWNNAIQKMIDAFELVQPNKVVYCDDYPTIYEGLDLFRKYFLNLWD
jgi:hypothetical protein